MSAAAALAARLGLDKRPRSWGGACPACDYPRAFSIRTAEGEGVRVFCANGCTYAQLADVLARVADADWTPRAKAPEGAPPEAAQARKQAAPEVAHG